MQQTSYLHIETENYFISHSRSSYSTPYMHYHPSYELYYLESGTREYFIEDTFFSVSAGDFVLIPPGKLHRTGGKYAVRTLIGFSPAFLERTYAPAIIPTLLKCFDSMHVSVTEENAAVCNMLLADLYHAETEAEFAVLLGTLLWKLSKAMPADSYNAQISSFIEYINQNYASIQSLEQIAEHFYISKYHLCRTFKAAMHMTVIDYLNNIKVKNACSYLETTSKSILDISQLCGFHSSAYFSNVFKKITRLSPSDYRKTYQKGDA